MARISLHYLTSICFTAAKDDGMVMFTSETYANHLHQTLVTFTSLPTLKSFFHIHRLDALPETNENT